MGKSSSRNGMAYVLVDNDEVRSTPFAVYAYLRSQGVIFLYAEEEITCLEEELFLRTEKAK
jgi:hypothetical protein